MYHFIVNPKVVSCFDMNYVLPGIERPAVVTKMNMTLSADHRVFEGNVAGIYE